jgi:hypothetical protein
MLRRQNKHSISHEAEERISEVFHHTYTVQCVFLLPPIPRFVIRIYVTIPTDANSTLERPRERKQFYVNEDVWILQSGMGIYIHLFFAQQAMLDWMRRIIFYTTTKTSIQKEGRV